MGKPHTGEVKPLWWDFLRKRQPQRQLILTFGTSEEQISTPLKNGYLLPRLGSSWNQNNICGSSRTNVVQTHCVILLCNHSTEWQHEMTHGILPCLKIHNQLHHAKLKRRCAATDLWKWLAGWLAVFRVTCATGNVTCKNKGQILDL